MPRPIRAITSWCARHLANIRKWFAKRFSRAHPQYPPQHANIHLGSLLADPNDPHGEIYPEPSTLFRPSLPYLGPSTSTGLELSTLGPDDSASNRGRLSTSSLAVENIPRATVHSHQDDSVPLPADRSAAQDVSSGPLVIAPTPVRSSQPRPPGSAGSPTFGRPLTSIAATAGHTPSRLSRGRPSSAPLPRSPFAATRRTSSVPALDAQRPKSAFEERPVPGYTLTDDVQPAEAAPPANPAPTAWTSPATAAQQAEPEVAPRLPATGNTSGVNPSPARSTDRGQLRVDMQPERLLYRPPSPPPVHTLAPGFRIPSVIYREPGTTAQPIGIDSSSPSGLAHSTSSKIVDSVVIAQTDLACPSGHDRATTFTISTVNFKHSVIQHARPSSQNLAPSPKDVEDVRPHICGGRSDSFETPVADIPTPQQVECIAPSQSGLWLDLVASDDEPGSDSGVSCLDESFSESSASPPVPHHREQYEFPVASVSCYFKRPRKVRTHRRRAQVAENIDSDSGSPAWIDSRSPTPLPNDGETELHEDTSPQPTTEVETPYERLSHGFGDGTPSVSGAEYEDDVRAEGSHGVLIEDLDRALDKQQKGGTIRHFEQVDIEESIDLDSQATTLRPTVASTQITTP